MKLGFWGAAADAIFIRPGEERRPLDLIQRLADRAGVGRLARHFPGPGPGFWAWSPGREAVRLAGPGRKINNGPNLIGIFPGKL